mmetsp:Transcript_2136/g.3855  ORF Transcript_2136/g.3855 Transcript_2136/m.3855 type:complete len:294 (-) Transcript_2136:16-897(-)
MRTTQNENDDEQHSLFSLVSSIPGRQDHTAHLEATLFEGSTRVRGGITPETLRSLLWSYSNDRVIGQVHRGRDFERLSVLRQPFVGSKVELDDVFPLKDGTAIGIAREGSFGEDSSGMSEGAVSTSSQLDAGLVHRYVNGARGCSDVLVRQRCLDLSRQNVVPDWLHLPGFPPIAVAPSGRLCSASLLLLAAVLSLLFATTWPTRSGAGSSAGCRHILCLNLAIFICANAELYCPSFSKGAVSFAENCALVNENVLLGAGSLDGSDEPIALLVGKPLDGALDLGHDVEILRRR